jgi:hypothetical protein
MWAVGRSPPNKVSEPECERADREYHCRGGVGVISGANRKRIGFALHRVSCALSGFANTFRLVGGRSSEPGFKNVGHVISPLFA